MTKIFKTYCVSKVLTLMSQQTQHCYQHQPLLKEKKNPFAHTVSNILQVILKKNSIFLCQSINPSNPWHGCRFFGGCNSPTRTRTRDYPWLWPVRVWNNPWHSLFVVETIIFSRSTIVWISSCWNDKGYPCGTSLWFFFFNGFYLFIYLLFI
jgi:hypothetical protein